MRAPSDAPDAPRALEELASLLESGLGESEAEAEVCTPQNPCLCSNQPVDLSAPATLKALTACAGVTRGKAYLFTAADVEFEETAADAAAEQTRLQTALKETEKDFSAEISAAPGKAAKEILQAHAELLKDPFLAQQAQKQIKLGKSAPFAFNEAVRASIDVLKKQKTAFCWNASPILKTCAAAFCLN